VVAASLTSPPDDGIVVGPHGGRTMARKGDRPKPSSTDLLEKLDLAVLRWQIIDADVLRREIASDEKVRREQPAVWRDLEQRRLARNRETIELNRQLRAAGCEPMTLRPSLAQKLKMLQRLEASNLAEIAERHGKPLTNADASPARRSHAAGRRTKDGR
jgi:hypothetical protein